MKHVFFDIIYTTNNDKFLLRLADRSTLLNIKMRFALHKSPEMKKRDNNAMILTSSTTRQKYSYFTCIPGSFKLK